MAFTPGSESGHVLTFIFGTFFLVMMVMTLIYVVYYDDRHIPRFIAVLRHHRNFTLRHHQSDVTFARLQTRGGATSEGDDASVAGEVDLHFGTDQSIEDFNRAFNNPMFDGNVDPPTCSSDDNFVDSGELK
jgi:hypothetical protein